MIRTGKFRPDEERLARVVVEKMEDDHTLKAIVESDAAIAFDWLTRRVGNANTRNQGWGEEEPFATAISFMGEEQRRELIDLLTRETWPGEIVSLLVNKDPSCTGCC